MNLKSHMLDLDNYPSNLGGSFEGRIYSSYDRHIERYGSYGYYESTNNHPDPAYSTSQTSYTTTQGFYTTVSAHHPSEQGQMMMGSNNASSLQPNHHALFSSQNANLVTTQRISPLLQSAPSLPSGANFRPQVTRVIHQQATPVLSQRLNQNVPRIQLVEQRGVVGVQDVSRVSVMSPPAEIRGVGIKFGERVDFRTGKMFAFVKRLVAGGPAHLSNQIQLGDVLVQIDGSDVQGLGLAHIKHRIPGPKNSWVTLGFQGQSGALKDVTLPRTAYGTDDNSRKLQSGPAVLVPPQPHHPPANSNFMSQGFQSMSSSHRYIPQEGQYAPQRNLVYLTQAPPTMDNNMNLTSTVQILSSNPGMKVASSPSAETSPWIYDSPEQVAWNSTINATQMDMANHRTEWRYTQEKYPVVIEKDSDDIYSVQV